MTDGLLRRLAGAFRPELFVNHYGSSEIYTFTVCPDAPAKPGSAGKAGINQRIRVVRIGGEDPDDIYAGEPGRRDRRLARLRRGVLRLLAPSPTRTRRRSTAAGTSPATSATSTPTATSSSPAGSTT